VFNLLVLPIAITTQIGVQFDQQIWFQTLPNVYVAFGEFENPNDGNFLMSNCASLGFCGLPKV